MYIYHDMHVLNFKTETDPRNCIKVQDFKKYTVPTNLWKQYTFYNLAIKVLLPCAADF